MNSVGETEGSTAAELVEPDLAVLRASLPQLVVDTLLEEPPRPATWIEEIEGSIVLADISGFTPLSERLARLGNEGAEWLTNIINRYFDRMLALARSRGGDNLKFGGDALLILFRGEGHAHRAVTAALEMQKANRSFGTIRIERDRLRLRMSMGVHSARFFSAAVGTPGKRMQHLVLGNEAAEVAKAQGIASAGEVLMTESTRRLVEGLVSYETREGLYAALRPLRQPATWEHEPLFDLGKATMNGDLTKALASWGACTGEEGEHRKVSVVFVSLRGANELLERAEPAATLEELNRYVQAVVGLAERHGGYLVSNDIDSYGLKLILVFGAPIAQEQHAASAFRLALALNRELKSLGSSLTQRIGVNSGFVFCGEVGPAYRSEYTMLGDAVNLSARLMANAAAGQILVSEQTADEAGPGFATRKLEPLKVKGKARPVEVRSLEGEQPLARVAGSRTPLVGREAEMARLVELSVAAERWRGSTVVISGEAGTGKSRLAVEMERYQEERGWRILRGDCFAHTALTPFAPWIQVLTALFGIERIAGTHERTSRVTETVARLTPDKAELAPLLNTLLSLSIPQNAITSSIDEETRRERLMELVTALLRAEADHAPLALVIEDLQWADERSRRLAEYVSNNSAETRFLACYTRRPAPSDVLDLPPSVESIEIGDLDEEAALRLLRSVVGEQGLDERNGRRILAQCRGNPLFLEEVGRSLQGSDRAGEGAAIPDRVQALLMSRIDALPPTFRRVLRLAAVVGTTFELPSVAALLPAEQARLDLDPVMDGLVQADLVMEEGRGIASYRFKHNLLQEVAYESLLFARRRELHRAAGRYIEEAHAERLEAQYEALARHYTAAGDASKTVIYAVLSGDKARGLFAGESAIIYYEQALTVLGRSGRRPLRAMSHVHERLGDTHDVAGHHGDAAGAYRTALREWRRLLATGRASERDVFGLTSAWDERTREAALCLKIAVSHERNSEFQASLRWLDRSAAVMPRGQPLLQSQALGARSVALFRLGRYDDAIRRGTEALRVAQRGHGVAQLAYAHHVLANSYAEVGKLKQSVRHREAALELFEQEGNLPRLFAAHGNLALSYEALGELNRALVQHEACLATAKRVGNATAVAITHNNLGEVLLKQGEIAEAAEHFEQTVEIFQRQGERVAAMGLALVNLSRARLAGGDREGARQRLDEGERLLRGASARGLLTEALLQRAELALADGDLVAADLHGQECLAAAREMGMQVMEAKCLTVLGEVAARAGRRTEALENLRASSTLCARLGAGYEQGVALLLLAKICANTGQSAHYARRAASIFGRLRVESRLAQAQRLVDIAAAHPGTIAV